jgi:hypothetical protein
MYIYVYLKDRTTWLPKQNVDLLKICLETNFNTYDGKTYTQTDGTLIGKSISGPLAGIFFAWLEETVVKNGRFKAQIIFWRRMKGNIFFFFLYGESTRIPQLTSLENTSILLNQ